MVTGLSFLTIDATGDKYGDIDIDTSDIVSIEEYDCVRKGDACTMHYTDQICGMQISVCIPFKICKVTADILRNGVYREHGAFSFRGLADMMLFCFAFRKTRNPAIYHWKRRMDELGMSRAVGKMETIERNMGRLITTSESLPWPAECVDYRDMLMKSAPMYAGEGW